MHCRDFPKIRSRVYVMKPIYTRQTLNYVCRSKLYSTKLPNPPVEDRLPLSGIRVCDLTRVLAGPYCTQILADQGAEVIKIEHPQRGDDTRAWGPPFAKPLHSTKRANNPGESAYFLSVNRNKQSIGLSFAHPIGQQILHKIIASSDVLVENYIPGSLSKYGLAYHQLKERYPALIYASITGYGQTGPYASRAGYDVMVEAEMGLMHITGEPTRTPVKVGVAVTDLTSGLYCANAILLALMSRSKTGKGQAIDVALSDCQVATLTNIASSNLISGDKGHRHGTSHPSIVPYQAFDTADGAILIGGGNDRLFGILCTALQKPEWIVDARFKTNTFRVQHRNVLVSMITEITSKQTTSFWLDHFHGSGMPYAAVNDIQQTMTHPHVLARDMVKEMDHSTAGPIKLVNTPVKFSKNRPGIRSAPPTLGMHTNDILERLGYGSEIQTWREEGIIS